MPALVEPLATSAVAALSQRYRFTPAGPILIEMFPKHDDFAVRTAGLPGMIGALGACFGRVVTLDLGASCRSFHGRRQSVRRASQRVDRVVKTEPKKTKESPL